MSVTDPAAQPSGPPPHDLPPHDPATSVPRGRPPVVQLPTWVSIVLVLTLFASCSAASNTSGPSDGATSGSVSVGATDEEVQAMCRLLGAVAAERDIDVDAVFEGSGSATLCQEQARQAATP